MKLFYAPGACSLGIHLVLEELGIPFELERTDIRSGDAGKAALLAINPKGKVPTLQRDDGSVVTEYPAIAFFLGQGTDLWPAEPEAAVRATEVLDYCTSTVHMQGFTRMFRPGNFTPNEADHDRIKARGTEIIGAGFATLADTLGDGDWIAGPYSVADSALFYLEYWGVKRLGMTLPAPLARHFHRMLARPAVGRMLAAEGLAA